MQYLVTGSDGPGFADPQEVLDILENGILPTFEAIKQLQEQGNIIAGGMPVGERSFVAIFEARSNGELDQMLRQLPAWGQLEWEVVPLQSFSGRAEQEKEIVEQLRTEL